MVESSKRRLQARGNGGSRPQTRPFERSNGTIERDLTSDEIATVKAWLVATAQRLERATESRAA